MPSDEDFDLDLDQEPPRLDSITQEMVYHIASGLEDPADVAARYGITGEAWSRIENSKPFQLAVQQAMAELEKDGTTFKNKARLMAGDLKEMLYRMSKSGELTPMQAMRFWETLIRVAGLEPKNEPVAADTGGKFSVVINLNQPKQDPPTIDVTPRQLDD